MTGFYSYIGKARGINKAAAEDYIRQGYLLAPRTVLKGRTKIDPPALPAVTVELKNIPSTVKSTLTSSLGPVASTRRALMFSGGFDSMLLGMLAIQGGAQVTAVTVQFDGFNPTTVSEAVGLARKMELPHHILSVTIPEFISSFGILAGITDEPLLDLDLAVVYAALSKYHSSIGGKVFISGMGSDQWFGTHSLEPWPGGLAGRLDWSILGERAHQLVAAVHGYKFTFPFLSAPMVSLSLKIPAILKKDKKLLRALTAGSTIPRRGARTEIQIPDLMRRVLVKAYGHLAWPKPLGDLSADKQSLRQIVLGIWLQKNKIRIAGHA